MSAVAAPLAMHRPLAPEDQARADFYALLARLLVAPPDGDVLAHLAHAAPIPGAGELARAWQGLTDASKAMDADAAAAEYDTLFAGVGKAPVSIYAGYYAGAGAVDHPRVRIQNDLAALGLARPARVSEPEDHLAGLLETMRVLVAGGAGRGPAALEDQERFYESHLAAALPAFAAALGSAAEANYYRHVGALCAAFAALETESFKLE